MKITCPNCGEEFEIDASQTSAISAQIKDHLVDEGVEKRVAEMQKAMETEMKAKLDQLKLDVQQEEAKKADKLKAELEAQKLETARLTGDLKAAENAKLLAVNEAVAAKESELEKKLAKVREQSARLEGDLKAAESAKETAVVKARGDLEKQLNAEMQKQKEAYEKELSLKDETISQYKDLKARQSTKMVGEDLEQHCFMEFNKVRPLFGKNVYFEKDNKISASGSKGDFIYRETDDEGNELISIMFEMKNELDSTSEQKKGHKNEEFLKELDKDRREKNCEYAVLVTLLEADSDYYNQGICEAYQYEKMYIVRPQFFVPIITILRNAASNAMQYKQELAVVRNQNVDVSNFEAELDAFKTAFSKNFDSASKNFEKAIDEIDKTIIHLQKVKDALQTSGNQLRLANNKAVDLTVKKLTKNNPTMREMFNKKSGE